VVNGNLALTKREWTPLTPSRQLGDEIGRRRQLDVDAQALLERRELAHELVRLGFETEIDIDRRFTPTLQHSG
jgi:hypothetical protein